MPNFQVVTQTLKLTPETLQTYPHPDIGAYEARPEDETDIIGGLVVCQEIFGINRHFKRLSEHFAKKGYWVLAPAYFDHIERDVALNYDEKSREKGFKLMQAVGFEQMVLDTKQAGMTLRGKLAVLPENKRSVAVVGYCLGGSLAWAVSCKTTGIFSAASAYYGSKLPEMKDATLHNPVMAHFGKRDEHIPLSAVEAFQKAQPHTPVYLYDAGHGFNVDEKPEFSAEASALAETRTLEFFAKAFANTDHRKP